MMMMVVMMMMMMMTMGFKFKPLNFQGGMLETYGLEPRARA